MWSLKITIDKRETVFQLDQVRVGSCRAAGTHLNIVRTDIFEIDPLDPSDLLHQLFTSETP